MTSNMQTEATDRKCRRVHSAVYDADEFSGIALRCMCANQLVPPRRSSIDQQGHQLSHDVVLGATSGAALRRGFFAHFFGEYRGSVGASTNDLSS